MSEEIRESVDVVGELYRCACSWEPQVRLLGNIQAMELRQLCLHHAALVDALEKIKDRTEFWCPDCGWTGAERELEIHGANTEAGNDEMAYCPKCGGDEVCEFEPDEYAKEAIERAAKISPDTTNQDAQGPV
ncbi:hypothetical protein [Pseudodesulfovibrio karagichevae]|uniref:Uncharacterized protein n=1 Tax=Pseudodesulfovibrio karagichevae TaxID=3239305 RepID=A0ABV4JX31_9BACT